MRITFDDDTIDEIMNDRRMIAINNLLKLANERVWQVTGRPIGEQYEDCDDNMNDFNIDNARRSILVVQELLDFLKARQTDASQED